MEIARLRTVTTGYQGAPGVTTMYLRNRSGSAWSAIASQLIQQVADAWDEALALFPTYFHYAVDSEVQVISAETGLMVETHTGTPVSGVGTANMGWGPSAAGVLVRYYTAGINNGKRVKGSNYLVPVAIAAADTDGKVASTYLGYAQAFADSISQTGTYGQLVVYSRKSSINANGSAYDVTEATAQDSFTILRSRRD